MGYRDERDALQARVENLQEDLAKAQADAERLRAEAAAREAGKLPADPDVPPAPPSFRGRGEAILSLVSVVIAYVFGVAGFMMGMASCLGSGPGSCSATEAQAHDEFSVSFVASLLGNLLAIVCGILAVRRSRQGGSARTMGILGIVGAAFGLCGSSVLFFLSELTGKHPR